MLTLWVLPNLCRRYTVFEATLLSGSPILLTSWVRRVWKLQPNIIWLVTAISWHIIAQKVLWTRPCKSKRLNVDCCSSAAGSDQSWKGSKKACSTSPPQKKKDSKIQWNYHSKTWKMFTKGKSTILHQQILRGYCTPDQFFDYLCIFLKIYNTLVTSKICFL